LFMTGELDCSAGFFIFHLNIFRVGRKYTVFIYSKY